MKSRDRSYLPPATTLRRGYKQKARSNDWMSHRKPLIFTQESFSSFEMLYNSVGRSARSPGAYASRIAISDLFIPPETHDRFFGCIQFFSDVRNRWLLSLCGAKNVYVGFHTLRIQSKSDGVENKIDSHKRYSIPTADNDIKVQISGCN